MAKYPVPGGVKTRLARVLGADRACALYEAFMLDLAGRLAVLPYPVTWAFWPPTAPFPSLMPAARCRPQRGDDLGERMASAIADELVEHGGSVVVIGVDAPHLPAALLDEAAEALAGGADLVLGPAADGGYYLIGLARPIPELFSGVAWGSPDVLDATRERAARLGLRTHVLPLEFDVDEPGDLTRLRATLSAGVVDLPRTALLLGEVDAGRS